MTGGPSRISRNVFPELKRRKVFQAVAVYAAAAFVVAQAADIFLPGLGFPSWSLRLVLALLILGFPVAVVLAWIFDITPAGLIRTDVSDSAGPSAGHRAGSQQADHVAHETEAAQRAAQKSAGPPVVLPTPPTLLIGRENELAEVTDLLRATGVRVLTLTGPGGMGKTRLALAAAADLAGRFADGVFFVNLAPVTDPALVPSAIAQPLGVRESGAQPFREVLPEHLREKNLLLVLDNIEQVTDAGAFVAELLSAAPGLKVLVTSRTPLHVRAEREYPLPPLALPGPADLPPLEQLGRYESVRLFTERSQAVKPDFTLTDGNAAAVAEICRRLDGLPLAIELAAARIKILPPQALLTRLQSRMELLTGGARDLPERQQTLRGAIAWSYDLLSDEEKRLFRRLSVFSGGRTLEAIEVVCNQQDKLDVLEGVTSLVNKNLLRQEESAEGEPRFTMLETIHEYAREKLEESGDAQKIGRGHTEYFLALAEEAESQLTGAAQGEWLARLETEHDNLRGALTRALEQGESDLAGRVAATLSSFWAARGHYEEGRSWLAAVLSSEGLSPSTRAKALQGAGNLAWMQGEPDVAQPLYEESLAIWRELGEVQGIARALGGLSILASERGDFARAETLYEEVLARFREIGETRYIAVVLNNLGAVGIAKKEFTRAAELFQECLALARQVQHPALVSSTLQNLGDLARRRGDLREAGARLRESLRIAADIGHVEAATSGLAHMAQFLTAAGAGERASRLFGAAGARFAATGSHVQAHHRAEYDRDMAAARAQLGPDLWQRLYQEGVAMSLEEAISYALEEHEGASRSNPIAPPVRPTA